MTADIENRVPRTDAPHVNLHGKPRRVLGDVSANLRVMADPKFFDGKPLTGSQLKRTSATALDDSSGFTYLKRRRISSDRSLLPFEKAPKDPQPNAEHTQPALDREQQNLESSSAAPGTPAHLVVDDEDDDSSAERKSFSSLINYDPSSQNAAGSQGRPTPLFRGPSHAELLKMRLQVAMYKVKTNQIHVPFDELRENTLSQRQREYNEAEEAVAALRAEAQAKDAQRTHAHPSSALFPAPMLQPTDYSSRTIYGPTLASSPPVSRSSRPNMRDSALRGFGRRTTAEEELTSSVVKGRVAAGLLDLRRGAEGS
ncbi:hypothetical protein CB0940_00946 [Cercospora beticola]|uniref:Uncharacterized protein n=2 Tax=Cercospora beticola TaxID=122368 RepID=A0A2G5I7W6_CERBT|nr:hypothetical protein CB0940_00946 [Cercospora beticola]PIB00897.1 hypothetical protein CB0940_00946 [Cercospora beticola]CAK1355318.1 unnamed protein product [Cercospora beticola]